MIVVVSHNVCHTGRIVGIRNFMCTVCVILDLDICYIATRRACTYDLMLNSHTLDPTELLEQGCSLNTFEFELANTF